MLMYGQAIELAQQLGLYNQAVFFNDRWVPYAERGSYFLEADIGVSAHQAHIETRYAFRTRLLDYMWAGLPMVVSGGDELADMVAARGLGQVVPIGDSDGFAQAILALAGQPGARLGALGGLCGGPAGVRLAACAGAAAAVLPPAALCHGPRAHCGCRARSGRPRRRAAQHQAPYRRP